MTQPYKSRTSPNFQFLQQLPQLREIHMRNQWKLPSPLFRPNIHHIWCQTSENQFLYQNCSSHHPHLHPWIFPPCSVQDPVRHTYPFHHHKKPIQKTRSWHSKLNYCLSICPPQKQQEICSPPQRPHTPSLHHLSLALSPTPFLFLVPWVLTAQHHPLLW